MHFDAPPSILVVALLLLKGRIEEKDPCSAIVERSLGILTTIVVRNYTITERKMDLLSRNILHVQETIKPKPFKPLFQILKLPILHLQP